VLKGMLSKLGYKGKLANVLKKELVEEFIKLKVPKLT
jgi:hypothetical protein